MTLHENSGTRLPRIDLVYFESCPNVDRARANLGRAFASAGLSATWAEWVQGRPDTPEWAVHLPSPTVLVDCRDVAGSSPRTAGPSCAVAGAPSAESIRQALSEAAGG